MRSKIWVLLLLGSLIFSCSNSDSNEINIEEEFGSLPQINNSKNKAIELRISKCSFEGHVSNGNSIYKATITKEGVKLLLGSKLTCDYKNGAYIKEIENTPQVLRFEIFQEGTRLSNECECYFYYEITLKNVKKVPKNIFIGSELFKETYRTTVAPYQLQEIENRLNKQEQ